MSSHSRFSDAHRRFLSLVEQVGLPAPDEVEYWPPDEVVFFWNEEKVCVIVDLGDEELTQDELLSLVPAGMAA